MKSGSDNFRSSAIFDVINTIANVGIKIQVYEPNLSEDYSGMPVISDIELFRESSDLILANRWSEELTCVAEKVICRDIYNID
jgi:UDPglucose 6-dehydrogenase